MLTLVNEGLVCIMTERTAADNLLWVLNVLTLIAFDFLVYSFACYLYALIGERTVMSRHIIIVPAVICSLDVIVTIALCIAGEVFTIDGGNYYPGRLAAYSGKAAIIALVYLFAVVVKKRDYLGEQSLIAVALYISLPVLATAIESAYPEYIIISPTIALVLLVLYILVQTGNIEEGRLRERILEEISHVDNLTEVNNRRAFDKQIEAVKNEENVGVIYLDINKLKETNDRYGHFEGDRLIISMAELLKHNFRAGDIFRTGGDEFVVMIPQIEQKLFESKLERLEGDILRKDDIAAFGSAFGSGDEVMDLIIKAEDEMYRNKGRK